MKSISCALMVGMIMVDVDAAADKPSDPVEPSPWEISSGPPMAEQVVVVVEQEDACKAANRCNSSLLAANMLDNDSMDGKLDRPPWMVAAKEGKDAFDDVDEE